MAIFFLSDREKKKKGKHIEAFRESFGKLAILRSLLIEGEK